MRAGPKAAADPAPLPWRPRAVGAARFAKFCERFVYVPKGTGARSRHHSFYAAFRTPATS